MTGDDLQIRILDMLLSFLDPLIPMLTTLSLFWYTMGCAAYTRSTKRYGPEPIRNGSTPLLFRGEAGESPLQRRRGSLLCETAVHPPRVQSTFRKRTAFVATRMPLIILTVFHLLSGQHEDRRQSDSECSRRECCPSRTPCIWLLHKYG